MAILQHIKLVLLVSLVLLCLPGISCIRSRPKRAAVRRRGLKGSNGGGKGKNKDNNTAEKGSVVVVEKVSTDKGGNTAIATSGDEMGATTMVPTSSAGTSGDEMGEMGATTSSSADTPLQAKKAQDRSKEAYKLSKTSSPSNMQDKRPRSYVKESLKITLPVEDSGDEAAVALGDSLIEDSGDEVVGTPGPTDRPLEITDAPLDSATNPPVEVTEPPATDAPAATATATDAPATDAPATDAPATVAPATDAPATDAPATEVPATEAPATEAPATDAPATDAPATDAPLEATGAPTSQATEATEAPTGAPTSAATKAATESPVEPTKPLIESTDAPTESTDAPVVPTDSPLELPTDSPTSALTQLAAASPEAATDAPTPSATSLTPPVLECPTDVAFNGTMEFNFVFADREPTEAEISSVEDATLSFFVDLFRQEFGNSVTDISGDITSSSFDFGPPPVFTMNFEAVVPFSDCAPPLDDVNEALTLSDDQYEKYLTEYVFPIEPAGQHIFVLAARVAFAGTASYA